MEEASTAARPTAESRAEVEGADERDGTESDQTR
jgi:hypothetical protein